MTIRNTFTILLCLAAFLLLGSCKKSSDGQQPAITLSYGDSVFYVKSTAADYVINPVTVRGGQYFGFPEGIDIDENTGAITVNKSETGLRYKIFFIPVG